MVAVSIFEYNEEEELKKFGRAEYRSGEIKGKAEGKAESVILALEGACIGTIEKPHFRGKRLFSFGRLVASGG